MLKTLMVVALVAPVIALVIIACVRLEVFKYDYRIGSAAKISTTLN